MVESNSIATIVVLGSGYSGSGAVFDYLAGRSDIHDPFNGVELPIIQNPYGIIHFQTSVYESYYPPLGSEALSQLELFLKKADRDSRGVRRGYGLGKVINNYQNRVDAYINSITDMEFPFVNQFFFVKLGVLELLREKIKHAFIQKKKAFLQRIPVSQDIFIRETRFFITELTRDGLENNNNVRGVVLNQAGSYWCPEKILPLYNNPRIILVNRDPRDQFAELKEKKGLDDVSTFVNWYKGVMKMRSAAYLSLSEQIIEIQFECFVLEHNYETEKLNGFLGLETERESTYQPYLSKPNIGKFNKELTKSEVQHIENSLSEYLYSQKE